MPYTRDLFHQAQGLDRRFPLNNKAPAWGNYFKFRR